MGIGLERLKAHFHPCPPLRNYYWLGIRPWLTWKKPPQKHQGPSGHKNRRDASEVHVRRLVFDNEEEKENKPPRLVGFILVTQGVNFPYKFKELGQNSYLVHIYAPGFMDAGAQPETWQIRGFGGD